MNLLEKRYLKNPGHLIIDLRKAKSGFDHKAIIATYAVFSTMELCPNDTAEKYGKAAGIPPEAVAETTRLAIENYRTKTWEVVRSDGL